MLLEALKELCDVLEIKPDSVEQRSCINLMESAACVHTASLDKVFTQSWKHQKASLCKRYRSTFHITKIKARSGVAHAHMTVVPSPVRPCRLMPLQGCLMKAPQPWYRNACTHICKLMTTWWVSR